MKIKLIILLALTLISTSCAIYDEDVLWNVPRDYKLANKKNGVVIVSLGGSEKCTKNPLENTHVKLYLDSLDRPKDKMKVVDFHFKYNYRDTIYGLRAIELPAGNYEFSYIKYFFGFRYSFYPQTPPTILFKVIPGKITYIGHIFMSFEGGCTKYKLSIMDYRKKDLPEFAEMMNNYSGQDVIINYMKLVK